MEDKINQDNSQGKSMTDVLKSWMMVALTFIFVFLYAAALLGWLKPLTDVTMVTRLEPIIFVIIGYYFGRLPAQQNEKTLKEEINRQTQKADAAQYTKEQVQQEREALEEKVKNAKAALLVPKLSPTLFNTKAENTMNGDKAIDNEAAQHSIETAINILNS